jgi:hypothetical protein
MGKGCSLIFGLCVQTDQATGKRYPGVAFAAAI